MVKDFCCYQFFFCLRGLKPYLTTQVPLGTKIRIFQIYFVKTKTRVVERTIKITLKEYKSLGGNAFCSYEYAMLCKYIPFESRV